MGWHLTSCYKNPAMTAEQWWTSLLGSVSHADNHAIACLASSSPLSSSTAINNEAHNRCRLFLWECHACLHYDGHRRGGAAVDSVVCQAHHAKSPTLAWGCVVHWSVKQEPRQDCSVLPNEWEPLCCQFKGHVCILDFPHLLQHGNFIWMAVATNYEISTFLGQSVFNNSTLSTSSE